MRNTAADGPSAEQDGFPIALRDADLIIELNNNAPKALHDAVDFGVGLILRADRRLAVE
ncbi:hypothetical protein So717_22200 [Roseobacter cerasinus]|uniref:Uncharacterized protein n=1 Tax=Roseobacter cerasinus TaxID=2602289 RepID=A0A640VRP7_9RHOB|nr:hypothetical protein So717_22200 [Roseobacter cerasinus]